MSKENNLTDFLKDFANGVRKLWGIGNKETGETTDPNELIDPQEFITEDWLERPNTLTSANIRAKDDEGNTITIFGVEGSASGEPEPPTINLRDGKDSNGEYYITATTADGAKSERTRLSSLQPDKFKPENIKYGTTIQGVTGTYIGSKVPTCDYIIKNIGAFEGAASFTVSYTPDDIIVSEQLTTEPVDPRDEYRNRCFKHAPITLTSTGRYIRLDTYPETDFYKVEEKLKTVTLVPKPTASGGPYTITASASQ